MDNGSTFIKLYPSFFESPEAIKIKAATNKYNSKNNKDWKTKIRFQQVFLIYLDLKCFSQNHKGIITMKQFSSFASHILFDKDDNIKDLMADALTVLQNTDLVTLQSSEGKIIIKESLPKNLLWRKQVIEFWKTYPNIKERKPNYFKCEEWFRVYQPSEKIFNEIINSLKELKRDIEEKKLDVKYVSCAHNWLENKKWLDGRTIKEELEYDYLQLEEL